MTSPSKSITFRRENRTTFWINGTGNQNPRAWKIKPVMPQNNFQIHIESIFGPSQFFHLVKMTCCAKYHDSQLKSVNEHPHWSINHCLQRVQLKHNPLIRRKLVLVNKQNYNSCCLVGLFRNVEYFPPLNDEAYQFSRAKCSRHTAMSIIFNFQVGW